MKKGSSKVDFFELRIGRRDGQCFARVEGPDFEAEAELALEDLSVELGALASQHLRLRQLLPADDGASSVLRERADAVGRRLSSRVFEGRLGRSFEERRRAAEAGGRRLVLRLRLDPDPWLLAFPWEVLFGPGGRKPLAINEQTPLVRSLALPQPVELRPASGPLKVLVAEASPPGWPALATGEEIRRLEASFLGGGWWSPIELRILRAATAASLEKAVEAFRPQVVHFIGHGASRTEGGEPCLVLAGPGGGEERVDGQQLAALLDLGSPEPAARSIRLVVLNACRSGESLAADAFAGVAPRLVQQGVPAVVAMRYPISDAAAIACSDRLYQDLAAGRSVDQALSRARRGLYGGFEDLSWLAPVLFLRGEDGRILSRRPRGSTIAAGLLATAAATVLSLWIVGREEPRPIRPLPANIFRDHERCPSPEGLALGLELVEPWSFEMGDDRSEDAAPRHLVTLTKPFCLARTELTKGQWEAIVGSVTTRQGLLAAGADDADESVRLPKGGVSYDGAVELIARLNELARAEVFFLLTEAQWEYAARADSAAAYSFGDDVGLLRRYANCGPKNEDGFDGPARVASFEPNDWGFHDMQGNLTEWVRDWYAAPYSPGPVTDPTGPRTGNERVRRGGSYESAVANCGVAARASATLRSRQPEYGLRVARWPLP